MKMKLKEITRSSRANPSTAQNIGIYRGGWGGGGAIGGVGGGRDLPGND